MSKKETIAFLVLVAGIIIFCLIAFPVHAEDKPTSYVVHAGDTVWSIATEHNAQHKYLPDLVDDIISMNHLVHSHIEPGQTIQIP